MTKHLHYDPPPQPEIQPGDFVRVQGGREQGHLFEVVRLDEYNPFGRGRPEVACVDAQGQKFGLSRVELVGRRQRPAR
jgi:hypothetical protein